MTQETQTQNSNLFVWVIIAICFILAVCYSEQTKGVATTVEDVGNYNKVGAYYTVTDKDYILLCNLLAREYGSDSISVPEKSRVIQTVMNRVESSEFPDTIFEVISDENQFDGYVSQNGYSSLVTYSVQEAVLYCLNGKCRWETALYYWGDGSFNHFYDDYGSWQASYQYFLSHS